MKQPMETFRGVVYPAQCDAMGHLNIKEYVGFFDQAEWHCLAGLGFDVRLIREAHIGVADVRHVIEYRQELLAGDLVRVESEVVTVGTKSLTTAHRLYNATTGALCATMEVVTVQYDLKERQAIPLVEALRLGAVEWLEGGG